jgi:hypothetical protein
MRSSKRKAFGVGAAIVLLGAMLASTQFASGTTPPLGSDGGVVLLHMNTDGASFKYYTSSTTVNSSTLAASETFTGKNCNFTPGTPVVVGVASNVGSPGYQAKSGTGYGLGVNSGDGSQKCNQVNGSERLTLDFGTTALKGRAVDYAELDVEAKFNAIITVQLKNGNSDLGTPLQFTNPGCSAADCGPDSGDGDNYRIRLADPQGRTFTGMVLYSSGTDSRGAVSLEAGNDGTAAYGLKADGSDDPAVDNGLGVALNTKESIFHLVKVIDCGETVTTNNNGDTSQTASVTQTDEPGCTAKPYSFTHNGDSVEFLYPSGGATSSFTIEVNAFAPEPVPSGSVPMTTIDVDASGPLTTPRAIKWCNTNGSGPVLPTGEATCLVSQSTVTLATNQIQVTEEYYLEGDILYKR